MRRIVCFVIVSIVLIACNNNDQNKNTEPVKPVASTGQINYTVVKRFPHDTNSFTEGLLIHNGQLFESTGHTDTYETSRSLFGIVDMQTGKINIKAEIDSSKYFGEGIAIAGGKIYQLTETNKLGFLYDTGSYKKAGEVHYQTDGWGLTTDGHQLIMSDGSSNIIYRDPKSFAPIKTLNVTDNNGPVANVNELELINGFIYANEWLTDNILKIDTSSGKVVARIDLSPLKKEALAAYAGSIETNGIAYDAAADKIYVTGKLWPYLYEIKFDH